MSTVASNLHVLQPLISKIAFKQENLSKLATFRCLTSKHRFLKTSFRKPGLDVNMETEQFFPFSPFLDTTRGEFTEFTRTSPASPRRCEHCCLEADLEAWIRLAMDWGHRTFPFTMKFMPYMQSDQKITFNKDMPKSQI